MERHPQVVATIAAWAESLGYDAAIWTALASNFDEWGKGGEPFSVSAALQYLETLEGDDPAKFAQALAYIRKAPPEVETPVRERSRQALARCDQRLSERPEFGASRDGIRARGQPRSSASIPAYDFSRSAGVIISL